MLLFIAMLECLIRYLLVCLQTGPSVWGTVFVEMLVFMTDPGTSFVCTLSGVCQGATRVQDPEGLSAHSEWSSVRRSAC